MQRLSFDPLGGSWTLVLLLTISLAVGVFFLVSRERELSRARKRVELTLKLSLVALFAILFSRPAITRVEEEELPASFAILCDLSKSMSIADGANGATRYDEMRQSASNAREQLAALAERFDVRVLGFGDGVEELPLENGEISFPDAPRGTETPIGDALTRALRSAAGKRLLGVALLSDGAQRTQDESAASAQDAALRARDSERAIFAVPFGTPNASASLRDVSIADLRANDRVFLGNELTASGKVRLFGCEGLSIPLALELTSPAGEKTTVDQRELRPETNDATLSYQFAVKPTEPGEWKLRVYAPLQDGEIAETNNELSAFVDAVDNGLDVLYIEGSRRYEQKFLRLGLNDASDVRVRYWRPSTASELAKKPGAAEAQLVASLTSSRRSLEETFFSQDKYAVYALGDVDATAFQPNELKALAQRVEEGAGLVVMTGDRSLGSGGYAGGPLEELLPTRVLASERLPLDSDLASFDASLPESQRSRVEGSFRLRPAANGKRVEAPARLNPDPKKNELAWSGLPETPNVYRLGQLKPNAETIVEAIDARSASANALPVVVAQQYGLGRVVVVAIDSTWRWKMRGKEDEHARFWRQLFLWAAKMDELAEGELAIELERARFAPNEKVGFRLEYRPKAGEDPSALTPKATIVAPDGTRENIELTRQDGAWTGEGRNSTQTGDYQIEAEMLSSSGETLQTAKARFLVFARDLELERPDAAPDAMERLATIANGKVVAPDELSSFFEELAQNKEKVTDRREIKRTLFDTRVMFYLFVALAVAEWIARKRWGLA